MTIEELGKLVKAKYPQYNNMSDLEVGQRTLDKYPVYWKQITDRTASSSTDTSSTNVSSANISSQSSSQNVSQDTTQSNSQNTSQDNTSNQHQALGHLLGGVISSIITNPAILNTLGKISGAEPIAKGAVSAIMQPSDQKLTDQLMTEKQQRLDNYTNMLKSAKQKGDTVQVQHLNKLIRQELVDNTETPIQSLANETPTAKQILGGATTMGTWLLAPSMPMPAGWSQKAILTRAALSAPIGVSAGLGNALMENKDTPDVVKEMVKSGLTSAALSFGVDEAINGIRWLANKLPAFVNYVSEVPQETLEYTAENPKRVKAARESLKGLTPQQQAEKITQITQDSIRQMRSDLTKEWQERFNQALQENKGVRVGLNSYEQRLLNKVDDIMPLENIPKDVSNMSLKEAYDLYSQTEDILNKRGLYKTAEGAPIRAFIDKLKNKMISAFGGEDSTFARLLSDYSTKKQILDSADDLANAWGKSPQSIASAANNLKKVFNDDKFSYLDAMRKLEQETGKNLLDYIAAWNTNPVLPYRHGGFSFDELFRLLLSPITSPRAASALVSKTAPLRNLGNGAVTRIGRAVIPIVQEQISSKLNNPQ